MRAQYLKRLLGINPHMQILTVFSTGVEIFEKTKIQKVNTTNGEVKSVSTDRGDIKCHIFVNCAGMVIILIPCI